MGRFIIGAAFLFMTVAPAIAGKLSQTEPNPSLSPRDVVGIQVGALKNNDVPYANRGIEVTYKFASPANKQMTGPLERFKAMVLNPVYGPLIHHRRASFENVKIDGDAARIDVILLSKEDEYSGFRFILSRQHGNRYEGCWMTDAVIRFEVPST